jgi:hypothetical protein
MGAPSINLIFCSNGNHTYARAAIDAGWLYGACLPGTVYEPIYFADQDWKRPNRAGYFSSLASLKPAMATCLDWEQEGQFAEVLDWAEEAAQHVSDSVVIIPKVVGGVPRIPRRIGGKRVILGYSVPTKYGGSPLPLWELAGWPIHLLGGSPQAQRQVWQHLSMIAEVVSLDGNMTAQQSRKCRTWKRRPGSHGHWVNLKELGDDRKEGAPLECFKQSLLEIKEIKEMWK